MMIKNKNLKITCLHSAEDDGDWTAAGWRATDAEAVEEGEVEGVGVGCSR